MLFVCSLIKRSFKKNKIRGKPKKQKRKNKGNIRRPLEGKKKKKSIRRHCKKNRRGQQNHLYDYSVVEYLSGVDEWEVAWS